MKQSNLMPVDSPAKLTMMMAESDDGIHWKPSAVPNQKPDLPANHLFTVPSGSGGAIYHDPKQTDGYGFRIFGKQTGEPVLERILADLKHPRHFLAKAEGGKRYFTEGITLVSKDGISWELKTGGAWNWLLFQPDPLDTEGALGMYGLPVIPVGNGAGFVGLLWLFHNSSSEPVNSFDQFYGTRS